MTVEDMKMTGGGYRHRSVLCDAADAPLVTVVTAVLNGVGTIKNCLESVVRQDYENIEHIVLDGGSTDGTLDVLRQYDDRIALWKSEPDAGIYDAWNKALAEARGEWICFLGADDEFVPGADSAYMELAAKNPEAEYLSSRVKLIHSSGYGRIVGSPWTWGEFSSWMCTFHVGTMHHRSLFDRLGKYDTSYRIVADYEFLLRARDQLNTAYMPVITATMRAGGISDSFRALREASRARVETGGQSIVRATIELRVAMLKRVARKVLLGLRARLPA